MKRFQFQYSLLALFILILGSILAIPRRTEVLAQQPSETPASSGMFITVISTEPQINVRMGPGSIVYPVVGFLLPGETAPALGRSPGGDWIQIEYPAAPGGKGWVYSPLVAVSPGTLRIVEPPPTPAPPATSTIDPTLEAQFNAVPTSTRLPTFTPPAAFTVPAFTEATSNPVELPVSMASMIIFFFIIGLSGLVLSLLRRR